MWSKLEKPGLTKLGLAKLLLVLPVLEEPSGERKEGLRPELALALGFAAFSFPVEGGGGW